METLEFDDTEAFLRKETKRIHCFSTAKELVSLSEQAKRSAKKIGIELNPDYVLAILSREIFVQRSIYSLTSSPP